MSTTEVLFTALYIGWLATNLTEICDATDVHAGVSVDAPHAPHQWHDELLPQPVLLPIGPVPQMMNTSMEAARHWVEQQERDALFTMEVARKNQRNALLTVLTRSC